MLGVYVIKMNQEEKIKMIKALKDATEILQESGLRQFQSDIVRLGIEIYKEDSRKELLEKISGIEMNTRQ